MMGKHELGPEPDAPMDGEEEAAFEGRRVEWARRLEQRIGELKAQCAQEHVEVVGLGGLHIVGTERHESRRIDNQLRGRAGRQGDPGSSIFYLSLEDELMRIFGSDRISGLMERMGMKPGEQIEHPWLTKSIEGAQKKVEAHNFDIRKNLLDYDDVMNQQRRSIYALRRMVLGFGAGVPVVEYDEDPKTKKKTRREKVWTLEAQREHMLDLLEDLVIAMVEGQCPPNLGDWNLPGLSALVQDQFGVDMKFGPPAGRAAEARQAIEEQIFAVVSKAYAAKEAELGVGDDGVPVARRYEQWLYLQAIDQQWKDHLLSMDHLRQGIGLRGYGQKDPKQEYKKEGYEMFVAMTWRVKSAVIGNVLRLQLVRQESAAEIEAKRLAAQRRALQRITETHAGAGEDGEAPKPKQETVVRQSPKVGRNDPCPCGSGKKYKKCHGATEASA
jgi:preprotein translocase subunit SecA